MPVITPPVLTNIPDFPALSDRAAGTYNSKAFAFGTHMADVFNGEMAALAANVQNNAQQAVTAAAGIDDQAAVATAQAVAAAASATTAATQATNASTSATTAAAQASTATTKAGEAATSATNAASSATSASASATTATAQASTATTKAGEAATSATNAASSATSASASATTAAAQASTATAQADAARSIVNFAGVWGTLTGALSKPATVFHAGLFYALVNNLANVAASEPGLTADWVASSGTPTYTYANRSTLRGTTGSLSVVDGLGLFGWEAGSTEPDDDESCFATATGCWLLQAAHWDLVDSWQAPDDAVRDEYYEDEPLRFAASFAASFEASFAASFEASFAAKVITGTATCDITSVAPISSASFTGTVTGAAPGDRVIATPPGQLGDTTVSTGQLGYHAWVSAANTVTVILTNASASAANTNPAIRTAWPVTVIKS
jgi:hypothetical protein